MLRWIILAVLVVAITATATVVMQSVSSESSPVGVVKFPVKDAAKPTGPQPRAVVVGDPVFKFESMAQHTKFEKEWLLKNEGQGELILELEAPPCSCTVANFVGKDGKKNATGVKVSVPPGGDLPIHFTWETRDYNGKYRKPAILLTNDPERPKIQFVAEGAVYPAVVVFPEGLIKFNEVTAGDEVHSAHIAVFSPDRPETKITRMSSSRPEVFATSSKPLSKEHCAEIKAKAGWLVTIDLKEGLPLGTFLEELVIETDHPKQPRLQLPISGKMVGPISVIPERVRLTDVSSSRGFQREMKVLVRGKDTVNFHVQRAPQNFKVEFTPDGRAGKATKYKLSITIPAGTPAGTVDDVIVVTTDHPHAGEIQIPINVVIRDEG
jgi:hypothetical protein